MEKSLINQANRAYILPLSAKSINSLKSFQIVFQHYLDKHTEIPLADIAYTLQMKREHFSYRNYIVGQNYQDIIANSKELENTVYPVKQNELFEKKLIFMFSGQGSQYPGMATNLYKNESVFKNTVDCCFDLLKPMCNLTVDHLFDDHNNFDIQQTQWAQPLIFIISYSIAKLLESWNIKATALIGHSLGEYVAATLAEVFSLDDALKVIAERGRLMQSMPPGIMLAVHKSDQDIIGYLPDQVEISVINAPEYCVVSGSTDDIINLKTILDKANVQSTLLHTSHAFHSKMMDEASVKFTKFMETISLNPPKMPFISNSTGHFIKDDQALSPIYWGQHIKKPVLFSQGIQTLTKTYDNALFCEIGPGKALSSFVKLHDDKNGDSLSAINTLSSAKQYQSTPHDLTIYEFVAKLWCHDYPIDFNRLYKSENVRTVALPTYQFEKQRCWIDRPTDKPRVSLEIIPANQNTNLLIESEVNEVEKNIAKLFYEVLGTEKFSKNDNFFDLGGTSLSVLKLISKLKSLNINPSINDMMKYNSVYMLSKYNEKLIRIERIVLPLKINPHSHKNVFFIHPVGGTLFLYNEIITKLTPSYNYYGLQNINSSGQLIVKSDSLEELAAVYVNEIIKIQPHGSFILMGLSLGGTVAYEMSKQLKSMNRDINFIAMFDSWAFFSAAMHNPDNFKNAMYSQMQNEFVEFYDSIKNLKLENMNLAENICNSRWKLMNLLLDYNIPKIEEKINIHLFKAKTLDKYHIHNGLMMDNGWQKYTQFPIQIYNIPGNHITILHNPGVKQIADKLNLLLSANKSNHEFNDNTKNYQQL